MLMHKLARSPIAYMSALSQRVGMRPKAASFSGVSGTRTVVPSTPYTARPRQPIPQKLAPNHYRFPIQGGSVYRSIRAILALLVEELEGREVHVHFGWPTSSWLDRMAVGVFVASLMRLPKAFPRLTFSMDYSARADRPADAAAPGERVAGS